MADEFGQGLSFDLLRRGAVDGDQRGGPDPHGDVGRGCRGAETTFAWDEATQTATITDPTGRTRQEVYNGLNLVADQAAPGSPAHRPPGGSGRTA
jgi:hypothetical protein